MQTTLTSKGQMTLPSAVRARLGLEAGDQLLVSVQDDDTIILKRRPAAFVTGLRGLLPRPKRTTDSRGNGCGHCRPPGREASGRQQVLIALATHLLVRLLTNDDPRQAAKVQAWLKRNATPKNPAYVDHVVLCELGWVLERSYGYGRAEVHGAVNRSLQPSVSKLWNSYQVWRPLLAPAG